MNYEQALTFVHSFINYERTTSFDYPEALKLDRMRELAKEFGNPQKAYECLIIAGSKGKGSTAAMLSSILRMDNYKVGLYTSPHLETERERIQVNGLLISEQRFTDLAARLDKILGSYAWKKNPPTFFEVLTIMAFEHFKEMKVQFAVLEVGLGGLYDSTNIAQARVVGITPISLEHTDKLGKTISKIAVQKCGIIKGREIVVSAPQAAEAEAVIQKACEDNEAALLRVGREIKVFEREIQSNKQVFDVKADFGDYFKLKLPLLGRHQLDNAATAVGMAKSVEKKTRFAVSDIAVERGLLDVRWPGRLEVASDSPRIVLDGAQNPESARRLVEALARHFRYEKLFLILGVSSDKDAEGILKELWPLAEKAILTAARSPRARAPREVAAILSDLGGSADLTESVKEALTQALEIAGPNDLILVTGSLYVVGEARREILK